MLEFLLMLSFIPLAGLVITIIIEWLIYSIAMRKNTLKLLGYSILINGITNPIANLLFSISSTPGIFLAIEGLVLISEIFIIKLLMQTSYKKAILISIITNLITGSLSIFFR